MHKFQLTFNPSFCVLWPKIKIFHNKNLILVFDTQDKICEFTISQQSKNFLELEYFNKTEKHTKIKSDVIVQDQFLELVKIRVDDILLEPWFMTDGYYIPRYFPGYVNQLKDKRVNSELPKKIKSQLIWHFPGIFQFPSFYNFWEEYSKKKRKKEIIKFLSKDPGRVDKFSGSLDPCEEVVKNLKKIIL